MGKRQFYVDWSGKVFATGGAIGGWGFYKQLDGDSAPSADMLTSLVDSTNARWNVLFAKSDENKWHVFGANQDNVIAICIPNDKVFQNHNFGTSDTGENAGAAFTIRKDGSMYARKGTIAGWYLTSSYI
jgi:hypothetical protein